jgi:hypothetical protein
MIPKSCRLFGQDHAAKQSEPTSLSAAGLKLPRSYRHHL